MKSAVVDQAYQAYQSGQFELADKLYRQVLALDPTHFEARQVAALLEAQLRQPEQALPQLLALAAEFPRHAELKANTARLYAQLKQPEKAVEWALEAYRLESTTAMYELLGQLAEQPQASTLQVLAQLAELTPPPGQGRLAAIFKLRYWAASFQPEKAYAEIGRGAEANHALWVQALRVQASHAHARSEPLEPVVEGLKAAYQHKPVPELARQIAVTAFYAKQHTLALAMTDRALEHSPQDSSLWANKAAMLQELFRDEEAVLAAQKAYQLKPDDGHVRYALATSLYRSERVEEALTLYQQMAAEGALDFDATRNLALCYSHLCQHWQALELMQQLAEKNSDNHLVQFDRALSLLAMGDLKQGFRAYEWRRKMPLFFAFERPYPCPEWQGEDLQGKTILVWPEQGLGDQIMFARMASLLSQRGARVLFHSSLVLSRLLRTLPGPVEVLEEGAQIPRPDFHVPLLSLPWLLQVEHGKVPSQCPYLSADADLVAHYRERMAADKNFRIGLVFSSGHRPDMPEAAGLEKRKSFHPSRFAPLGALPGLSFYSLQKGGAISAEWPFEVIDYSSEFTSFDTTAALMANLDLVLSVDTSVAHMAGALGLPVWTLVRFDGGWPWVETHPDSSPWYPTMRLFRQQRYNDWSGVFEAVAAALADHLQHGTSLIPTQPKVLPPLLWQGSEQPLPAIEKRPRHGTTGEVLRSSPSATAQPPEPTPTALPSSALSSEQRQQASELLDQAVSLHQGNHFKEALVLYDKLLVISPHSLDGWHLSALALASMSRHAQAVVRIEKALAIKDSVAAVWRNFADILLYMQRYDDALGALRRAVELEPGNALYQRYCQAMGLLIQLLQTPADKRSADTLSHMLALVDDAGMLHNLALAADGCEDLELALVICNHALERFPDTGITLYGRGKLWQGLGDHDRALSDFDRALSLITDQSSYHYARGLSLLSIGDFGAGFAAFESRTGRTQAHQVWRQPPPEWLGEDLTGLSLSVWPEQGLGDQIMASRLLALLPIQLKQLVMYAPRSLIGLYGTLITPMKLELVCEGSAMALTDKQVPLMSLLHRLNIGWHNLPSQTPYLFADPMRIRAYRDRMVRDRQFRIGLVYSSGHRPDSPELANIEKRKTVHPSFFAPLARLGVSCYSLQKGGSLPPDWPFALTDWSAEFDTFDNTAALMVNLDLILTVDTSIAHLAGALGLPVWNLVRFDGGWPWVETHPDSSPWYPTMRLFRQQRYNDWSGVMERVMAALEAHLSHGDPLIPPQPVTTAPRVWHGARITPLVMPTSELPLASSPALVSAPAPTPAPMPVTVAVQGPASTSAPVPAPVSAPAPAASAEEDFLADNPLPEHPQARRAAIREIFKQAVGLHQKNQLAEALRLYRQVVAADPQHFDALHMLGLVLHSHLQRSDEARELIQRALSAKPQAGVMWKNLGVLEADCSRQEEAARCFEQAWRCDNSDLEAVKYWQTALSRSHQHEAQMALYQTIGDKLDHDADWLIAKAQTHYDHGLLPQSLALFDAALKLDPNHRNGHFSHGLALLASAQFEAGWAENEWRWASAEAAKGAYRPYVQPVWDGQAHLQDTLLVWEEQGHGDNLMFCRLLNDAAGHFAQVKFHVDPSLVRLMRHSLKAPNVEVIPLGQDIGPFDWHLPLMSLAHRFNVGASGDDSIPAYRYLRAPAPMLYRERLAGDAKLKVGLCWAGNPRYGSGTEHLDAIRSLPPELLAPLASIEGLSFYSLQKGEGNTQKHRLPLPLIDWSDEFSDFADTANLACALDLVISVDTSVAHLAAGLGVPVFLLNRFNTCWRWQWHRNDSPWYPSLRLFRQQQLGDWSSAIAELKLALQAAALYRRQAV